MTQITTELRDLEDTDLPPHEANILTGGGVVCISLDGLAQCADARNTSPIILIEKYDGKLMLTVWADVNQEDATHIIELDGASNSNRLPDDAPAQPIYQEHYQFKQEPQI